MVERFQFRFVLILNEWLATGRWFSPSRPSTNKTDRHDITEILLKVALNTKNQISPISPVLNVKSNGGQQYTSLSVISWRPVLVVEEAGAPREPNIF
jgi:hypothetical protein